MKRLINKVIDWIKGRKDTGFVDKKGKTIYVGDMLLIHNQVSFVGNVVEKDEYYIRSDHSGKELDYYMYQYFEDEQFMYPEKVSKPPLTFTPCYKPARMSTLEYNNLLYNREFYLKYPEYRRKKKSKRKANAAIKREGDEAAKELEEKLGEKVRYQMRDDVPVLVVMRTVDGKYTEEVIKYNI